MIYTRKKLWFSITIAVVVILFILYIISSISLTSNGIAISFIFNFSDLFTNQMLIDYLFAGLILLTISMFVFSGKRSNL